MANDPVMFAWMAKRRKNGRSYWTRIGRVFPHNRGSGLTVVLDVLPLDGRIVLFELNDKDDRVLEAELDAINKAQRSATPHAASKPKPGMGGQRH